MVLKLSISFLSLLDIGTGEKAVSRRISKPWIKGDILRSINTKHRLFKQFKDGVIDYEIYKNYRNYVSSRLKYAKRIYYKTVFDSSRGNLRKTWRNINSVLKGKSARDEIVLMDDNNDEVSDPERIANMFSSYFSTVASDLERNIPHPITNPMDYMGPIADNSFYATPSNPNEINRLICSLPNKRSHINSIPVFVFKLIAPEISIIISDLFNCSISLGIYPSCLKISRVTPLFKSSNK